jgi:hypothetical protein
VSNIASLDRWTGYLMSANNIDAIGSLAEQFWIFDAIGQLAVAS